MRAWFVLGTILIVVAGCIGSDDPAFVAAMEHLDTAEQRAEEMLEDPRLTFVIGLEPSDPAEIPEDEDVKPLARTADPAIGDGRAQAWGYAFVGNTSERSTDGPPRYTVMVAANGTILSEDQDRAGNGTSPIEDWRIDSDEAATIAAENNETWASPPEDSNGVLMLGGRSDADPAWGLGLDREDEETWVGVNATTGRYLGPFDLGELFNITVQIAPPAETGTFQDQVAALEPENTHTFEIEEEGHPRLNVRFSPDPAGTPGTQVNVTVTGPSDRSASRTWTAQQGGNATVSLVQPDAGDWRVDVVLVQGGVQRYRIDWCATGMGVVTTPPMEPRPPCGEASS